MIDLLKGEMENPDRHHVTRASGLRGYYANEPELERLIQTRHDPVHYEVFEHKVPAEAGHVMFGISKLQPGLIGQECFFTKGHYHTILATGETYLCLAGQGLMLMRTPEGDFACEEFVPGRLVYVPPCWGHRSVNTGSAPLVTLFQYQGDAGHNYGNIVDEGFPRRVYLRGGKIVLD
jgi:glucose-6-phosphate isomerase